MGLESHAGAPPASSIHAALSDYRDCRCCVFCSAVVARVLLAVWCCVGAGAVVLLVVLLLVLQVRWFCCQCGAAGVSAAAVAVAAIAAVVL